MSQNEILAELYWTASVWANILAMFGVVFGYRKIPRFFLFMAWILASIAMTQAGMHFSQMNLEVAIIWTAFTSITSLIFGLWASCRVSDQAPEQSTTPTLQRHTTGPITPKGWERE